jgi:hypothetical protein
MPQSQAHLARCPTELLLGISGHFDSVLDTSTLSRVNRRFHWLFGDQILRLAIKGRSKKGQSRDSILSDLFFHAVRHDSTNIITFLTLRSDEQFDVRG